MIKKGSYPVLDFDDDKDSVVNPFKWEIVQSGWGAVSGRRRYPR